jgi:hypothetical protein
LSGAIIPLSTLLKKALIGCSKAPVRKANKYVAVTSYCLYVEQQRMKETRAELFFNSLSVQIFWQNRMVAYCFLIRIALYIERKNISRPIES